jgi:SAM-dependent methyltransferase
LGLLVSGNRDHWQSTYAQRTPQQVSWYEPRPLRSLELIAATGVATDASILDLGGGTSTLAAELLAMGYTDLTVADISPAALAGAKGQLSSAGEHVTWIEADVRNHDFHRRYELWHDRAVFHFMVSRADRDGYLQTLRRTLRPGGHLIVATFGPDGPTHCSGLPVERYDAEGLQRTLGEEFELIGSSLATHNTPSGSSQQFLYAHLLRR